VPRNPYLCLAIVAFLGAAMLLAIGGIIVANSRGLEPSPALVALASGCVGSLSSFLVSVPRGSVGTDQEHVKKP
jgi:hypothetical protein